MMDHGLMYFVFYFLVAQKGGDLAEILAKAALRRTGKMMGAWFCGMAATMIVWQVTSAYLGVNMMVVYLVGATAFALPVLAAFLIPRMFPQLAEAEKRIEIETRTRRELEDDADYQAANETAGRIRGLLARTEWSDARRFVDDMVTEQLPTLIRLRRELSEDRERLVDQIGKLGRGAATEGRRTALTATRDRLDALRDQASERVAASTDALAELLVIARERQLNDSPDATERADRLLAETRRANDLLLATRREVESVGTTN